VAAATLCLTSTACSEDISGGLETVEAAEGPPSYFLGRSYAGLDLTHVEAAGSDPDMPEEGAFFVYGDCDAGSEGCSPPIEVQNGPAENSLKGAVIGCGRLADVRGVPAVLWGDGLVLFTQDSTVTIFKGGADSPGGDLRSMAEALRPVSGPADVTKPLPAPAKDILDTIAKNCGAAPGDHGAPIPR
jgi:hypothetical protein